MASQSKAPPPLPPPPDVSSSMIVTVAVEFDPKVVLPEGLERTTVKDSSLSSAPSFVMLTAIVLAAESPAARLSVPLALVKSEPAVAEQDDVA